MHKVWILAFAALALWTLHVTHAADVTASDQGPIIPVEKHLPPEHAKTVVAIVDCHGGFIGMYATMEDFRILAFDKRTEDGRDAQIACGEKAGHAVTVIAPCTVVNDQQPQIGT